MKMRTWVECDQLNIRITLVREGSAVQCIVDPGVPSFVATPAVLRALARAMEATADTADDLLSESALVVATTGLIHNPQNPDGRLPVLPAMIPGKPNRAYVRRRKTG